MHRKIKEICPICGNEGLVSKVWTVNKYGRKYSYIIYNHGNIKHYYGINNSRKINKKGEVLDNLTNLLSSDQFRLGLFSLSELQTELEKRGLIYNDISVRNSLLILVRNGLISISKKGKNVFYVNGINKAKLNFTFLDIHLILEEIKDNEKIDGHTYKILLRNDKYFYLNFIPFNITGDKPSDFQDLNFNATDLTMNKKLKIILLENKPKEKRMLLRFDNPIPPGKEREIELFYEWEEITPTFTFGSASEINRVIIEVKSKIINNMKVTQISPDRMTNIDITEKVLKENENGINSYKIEVPKFLPFSMLYIQWFPKNSPQ